MAPLPLPYSFVAVSRFVRNKAPCWLVSCCLQEQGAVPALRLFGPWRRSWCQALDTALVAPATRSTTPTSDGARGMTVEAVRYTRRLSPCARADLRCKSMPAQDYSELNARVRQTWCVPRTDKPPAGPHLAGQCLPRVCPTGRVSGAYRLTVCVCRAYRSKLQATSTDLYFGAGDKQGRLRYHRLST